MTESSDYASFRQRLDAVLRTRDVRQVRAFLIEEDHWSLDQPTDPEYAMWLMIAGTPTLKELHGEARQWLITHDHSEAADAVFNRAQKSGQPNRGSSKSGTVHNKKTGSGPRQTRPGGSKQSNPKQSRG
ncbi:MAG TPA: hypothetical protein VF458_23435 [Ktedonobacteraceae bacterium]